MKPQSETAADGRWVRDTVFRFHGVQPSERCQANADADKNERIHFIPVYVTDGQYSVSVSASYIWTPAGMVTATRNESVTIDGTIYDDWYQG